MKKLPLLFVGSVVLSAFGMSSAAGCSSSDETTPTADAAADVVAKDGKAPPVATDEPDEDAGPQVCPTADPITEDNLDQNLPYKYAPATKMPGSCTDADLAQLKVNQQDSSLQSWNDLGKGLSAACVACFITKDTDTRWGVVVANADNDGQTGFYNFGACYGAFDGDKCGKDIQWTEFCLKVACADCTSDTENDNCVRKAGAKGGACESLITSLNKDCPSLAQSDAICNSANDAVNYLCGTPSDGGTDGGTDSGTDAGTDAGDDAGDDAGI